MISVIIPTYNREGKIIKALESVRNQKFQDIEIIVVDDGSTDSTCEVVSSIKDSRIRYIKHEKNKGGCAARNTGIVNAKGEYIAFQDSDDVWYPNKLEIELKSLIKNEADIVFCKMNRIAANQPVKIVPDNYAEGFLKTGSNVYGIGTPTLLGKADIFKKNLFDEELPRLQELELLIRLVKKYKIYCCDQALMDTYYDDSAQATSGNPQKLLEACRVLHSKYPELRNNSPELSERIARNLLVQSYKEAVNDTQKEEMRKLAVKIDPSYKTFIKYLSVKIGLFPQLNKQAKEILNETHK